MSNPDPTESVVLEDRFRAMASATQAIVVASDHPKANKASDYARQRIAQLEARWSRFIATSEITRLNTAGGQPVSVSADTQYLVSAMIEAHRVSAGTFDPTLLAAVVSNGYDRSVSTGEAAPTVSVVAETAMGADAVHGIEIDPSTSSVRLPPGVGLDPGGIGKGLAADLVVAELIEQGLALGALVSIGGDVACDGTAVEPGGWVIGLEAPVDTPTGKAAAAGEIATRIQIERGGVATSSTQSRTWQRDGVRRHHIIDPTTHHSADGSVVAATVVAGTAWLAEALALTAVVDGATLTPRLIRNELEEHGVDGIVWTRSGPVLTPAIAEAMFSNQAPLRPAHDQTPAGVSS